MRRALLHREDARVEVVEAFDGLVGGHERRLAIGDWRLGIVNMTTSSVFVRFDPAF